MTKPYKIIVVILISVTVLSSSYFIGKRAFYYESGLFKNRCDVLPQKPGFVTYIVDMKALNANQLNLFKLLPHDTSDIVFVGTSLTQGFPLQEMLSDAHLKNRGIGGNTITDVRKRIDEVVDGHPKKIFLEVGTNDLGSTTVDSVFNKLKDLVGYIQDKTPKTAIYVNSILPFGTNNLSKIKTYNTMVSDYCIKHRITYINLYPLFVGIDGLKPSLTIDGTHLKAYGYLIWSDYISKYIKN